MFFDKILESGGGGSITPGTTPVVGTEHAILYIDSAILQGSANFTYDGTNVLLTDGYFRAASIWDDYTYGNTIRYGASLQQNFNNLTEGYGALTYYGTLVNVTVPSTNMKRSMGVYGHRVTMTLLDGVVDESVYAYGWFRTSSGNVSDGETVTVGTVTYTFRNTLSAEGDVKIGASQFLSLSNLGAAINGTGTYGVDHQVTAANADATCTGVYSTAINLVANAIGSAGESVALAETSARLTRSAATLLRKSASSYSGGVYGHDIAIDVQKASLTGALGIRAIVNVGTNASDQTCSVTRGIETQVAVNALDATVARGTMHGAYFGAYVNGGLMTDVYGLQVDMTLQNDGGTSFSAVSGSVYGIKISATGSCLAGTTAGDAIALYIPDFSFCMASRTFGIMQLGYMTNYFEGPMTFLALQTGGVVTATAGTGALGLVTDAAGVLTSDGSGNLSFAAVTPTLTSPMALTRTANDATGFEINVIQSRGSAGIAGDQLFRQNIYGYNDGANNGGVPQVVEFAYIEAGIAASGAADDLERGYLQFWVKANYDDIMTQPSLKIHQNLNYYLSYDFLGSTGTTGNKGPAVRILCPNNAGGLLILDSNGGDSNFRFTSSAGVTEWFTYGLYTVNGNHYCQNPGNGVGVGAMWVMETGTGNYGLWCAYNHTFPTSAAKNLVISNGATAPSAVPANSISLWCADYAAGDARLYLMGEKNTNKIAFGAGRIHFDPVNMADDSVAGETFTAVAGENLVWGDVVYRKSDGKFWKADYNATTTTPAVAFCTQTIAADASGEFLKEGWVRDDSAYNFTVGAQTGTVYLGTTGAITQTAPTGSGDQVQVLGWAYSADIFYFDPQLVMVEV